MLGVYFHIPFCVKKCFYCDFYSIETEPKDLSLIHTEESYEIDESIANQFLSSLENEIKIRTNDSNKIEVDSIFLGGGTPSLLSPQHIKLLFQYINEYFQVSNSSEITIECNPGTITPEKLEVYKVVGINRLSIGVQSFIPEELKFLQRIHNSEDVFHSFKLAREFGFDNISIDLIFSIPGQKRENLIYSLSKAIELNPEHISAYSLIFEKGTPLYNEMKKGKIKPVDDNIDSELYEIVIDFLTDNGYEQYEVSNFAKNQKYCNHNLKYWHNQEYLAFGPSAHGFYKNIRYKNKRSLKTYINLLKSNTLPIDFEEFQDDKTKLTDTIFLGLRSDGIDFNKLMKNFKLDLRNIIKDEITFYKENDFIYENNDKIILTKNGYKICDSIAVEIITKIDQYFANRNFKLVN
ncbi:MAG: radical SAM family heme chaperone HemW [Candidatus Kapabacteria bacterium]|nr:radical SAM family heme chaperone HemW [Candidatus Kapabacteria bacterium]